MNLLDEQLNGRGRIAVLVLLDSKADVKRFSLVDAVEIARRIECDRIEHLARCVVDELKFDVFELLADKFARTEILHAPCAESGFLVAWPERIEKPQCRDKFGGNLAEGYDSIDVDLRH